MKRMPMYVIEVHLLSDRTWLVDVLQDISVIGRAGDPDATTAVVSAMTQAGKSRLGRPFASKEGA